MTEAALQRRVQFWIKKLAPLGLGHWEIDVEVLDNIEHDAKGTCRAQIKSSPMYDEATIEFNKAFVNSPDIDYLIVHELLHAVMRDLDAAIHGLCGIVSRDAAVAFDLRVDHEEEGVIDRVARSIVNLAK